MLIRDELQIKVTPHQHGAAVRFPKDRFLISDFKARFPRARWGGGTKSWHIPGKLAGHRAQLWADQQQPYLRGLEQAARDAEWDDPAPAIISKGSASAPVERPLPADADPFGLPWADWYNLSGENRIRGARWPKYICELHRDLHELGHAPGFALRLPSTGEMVRLMVSGGRRWRRRRGARARVGSAVTLPLIRCRSCKLICRQVHFPLVQPVQYL